MNVFINPMTHAPTQALTIAGSDSGGGAGIQADLKTFAMRQVFGTSVLTATTAQNTKGVFDIHHLPIEHIIAQLNAIKDDFCITACKIGMLGTSDVIRAVGDFLKDKPFGKVVLDPVMIAKGGQALLDTGAMVALRGCLGVADILTPNLPEAQALTGLDITKDDDIVNALRALQNLGAKTVIIKGGHHQNSQSTDCTDWVLDEMGKIYQLTNPRIDSKNTHGTGCSFSACIAAELAKGESIERAIKTANTLLHHAIKTAKPMGEGHNAVNHWAFLTQVKEL